MEIGGYLELERNRGEEYHSNCLRLNTARNCIRYLIEAREIKRLWLSRWNCSAVINACQESGIEICYFDLDSDLKPVLSSTYQPDDYVYVVNYFGMVSDVVYEHMILDNVQAFFQKPIQGVDTIYTCRKFFGVTDGAYLYTDSRINRTLNRDNSWDRITYLAGRFEKSGSEFFSDYQNNEKRLDLLPLEIMSGLTQNVLRGIDYGFVKEKRQENFRYLSEKLGVYNQFHVHDVEGPFAYPLMTDRGEELRNILHEKKIYISKLWPNVINCSEAYLADNILPIPCDQRYTIEHMKFIVDVIILFMTKGD